MFRNEVILFSDFLKGNSNLVSCFTQESAKFLTNLMCGDFGVPLLLPFESPDILLLFDDRTIMLEHYRFDSSESRKGGSLLQEEKKKFDKDSSSNIFRVKKMQKESSIEFYIENILRTSEKHIAKYKKYINNVSKKKGVTIGGVYREINHDNKAFGIVTQDVSLDYNMFKNKKDNMEYITPFHLNEFRSFLKIHSEIEHVFHMVSTADETKRMYYFHNKKSEMMLLDEIMDYTSPNKIEEADVYYWSRKQG